MVTNSQTFIEKAKKQTKWSNLKIGITGAKGSLGKALIKALKSKGAYVIGISHSEISKENNKDSSPNKWVKWECGQEEKLDKTLLLLDILILNHGINPKGKINQDNLNKALDVNALSVWRILERFERITKVQECNKPPKEIWINTSEAEILPALSPGYEISKRLIGQLVSLKWCSINRARRDNLIIRKLVLGPFKSNLNPIGIMSPKLVADQIINQASLNFKLIIITPNPLTYILIPLNELIRSIYFNVLNDSEELK